MKLQIEETVYLLKNGVAYTGLYVIIEPYQQLVFIKELNKKVPLSDFTLIKPAKNKVINLYMEKL